MADAAANGCRRTARASSCTARSRRPAQTWDSGGRSPDELYRGARLARSLEWAAAHAGELNVLERAFLDASTAAGGTRSRQSARRSASASSRPRRNWLRRKGSAPKTSARSGEDDCGSARYGLAGALVAGDGVTGGCVLPGRTRRAHERGRGEAKRHSWQATNAKQAESEQRIAYGARVGSCRGQQSGC